MESTQTAHGYNLRKRKTADGDLTKLQRKRIRTIADLSPISRLTDDALAKIISFIPIAQWARLELVNHQFQRAAHMNWSHLHNVSEKDFVIDKYGPDCGSDSILKKLFLRSPNIKSISGFLMGEGEGFRGVPISYFAQFNKLESISFPFRIVIADLAKFLETSKSRGRLRNLDFGAEIEIEGEITNDEILREAFSVDKFGEPLRLEKLSFATLRTSNWSFGFLDVMDTSRMATLCLREASVPPIILINLIGRCIHLKHLEFGIDENFAGNKKLLQAVAESPSENLSILIIDNDHDTTTGEENVVNMINSLGQRPRPLSELSLNRTVCDDQIIAAIGKQMKNLKALELCTATVASSTLIELFANLTNLEKFSLSADSLDSMNENVVSTMVTNLKHLKQLSLMATDRVFISKPFNSLFQLQNLKELSFTNCYFYPSTLPAWGAGSCSKLETLSLTSLYNHVELGIKDDAIMPFLKKLPNLRRFTFGATNIGDVTLRTIVSSCPNLQEIELYRCNKTITLNGLQSIVDGCPLLKRLTAIAYAYPNCPRLTMPIAGKYRKIHFTNSYF